ncbi:MAG: 30S ribosomal protein S15 [Methanobacteriota archaeon]|nr:MAG: 30S ribosomal protein S15 [Euryarchaeota archaeon]
MAKLHSKKRGKSKSRRPGRAMSKPDFVEASPAEIEDLVRKLYRQGHTTAQIGIILRDQYGIPSFRGLTGKTMVQFLREEKLYSRFPEDMLNLLKKAVKMYQHLQKNRKDVHNKVKYNNVVSKVHRLAKYYKKRHIIPATWKYKVDEAAALVR